MSLLARMEKTLKSSDLLKRAYQNDQVFCTLLVWYSLDKLGVHHHLTIHLPWS